MTEEQLRRKNLYYYSIIARYSDAMDAWVSAPKGSKEKADKLGVCRRLEKVMRAERDKYKALQQPLTIDEIEVVAGLAEAKIDL